jgi:hypothetical protein
MAEHLRSARQLKDGVHGAGARHDGVPSDADRVTGGYGVGGCRLSELCDGQLQCSRVGPAQARAAGAAAITPSTIAPVTSKAATCHCSSLCCCPVGLGNRKPLAVGRASLQEHQPDAIIAGTGALCTTTLLAAP